MTDWTSTEKQMGWRIPPRPEPPKIPSPVTIRIETEDSPRYAREIDAEGRLQYFDLNP